jgi:uncharacterized protein
MGIDHCRKYPISQHLSLRYGSTPCAVALLNVLPGCVTTNVAPENGRSIKPMTGFYRDGCCNTGREDVGSHTICAVMTPAFLEFSKSRGNDLSTPVPAFGFPALNPGDRWCLCAPRWQEAFEAGHAPRVVLRATHEGALRYCSLADLKRFAVDLS